MSFVDDWCDIMARTVHFRFHDEQGSWMQTLPEGTEIVHVEINWESKGAWMEVTRNGYIYRMNIERSSTAMAMDRDAPPFWVLRK